MRKSTETRIYLSAIAFIFAITVILISYMNGRVAESMHRNQDALAQITAERQANAVLQARYDALASETDPVTIISAEMHYQQRAGQ